MENEKTTITDSYDDSIEDITMSKINNGVIELYKKDTNDIYQLKWNPDLETLLKFLKHWLDTQGIDATMQFIKDLDNPSSKIYLDSKTNHLVMSKGNLGYTTNLESTTSNPKDYKKECHKSVATAIKTCVNKLNKLNLHRESIQNYYTESNDIGFRDLGLQIHPTPNTASQIGVNLEGSDESKNQ